MANMLDSLGVHFAGGICPSTCHIRCATTATSRSRTVLTMLMNKQVAKGPDGLPSFGRFTSRLEFTAGHLNFRGNTYNGKHCMADCIHAMLIEYGDAI